MDKINIIEKVSNELKKYILWSDLNGSLLKADLLSLKIYDSNDSVIYWQSCVVLLTKKDFIILDGNIDNRDLYYSINGNKPYYDRIIKIEKIENVHASGWYICEDFATKIVRNKQISMTIYNKGSRVYNDIVLEHNLKMIDEII